MKKLALIAAIILVFKLFPTPRPIFYGAEGSYTFYLDCASSECRMVSVDSENAEHLKKRLKGVYGESVRTLDLGFEKSVVERYGAKLVFSETVDGIVINYYFSEKLNGAVDVGGKKVNLQTAVSGGALTVGTPMIFGSF